MFQLNHSTLVNKAQIEVWLGSLAFLQRKATLTALHCFSLLFSFCSLGTLDLQSLNGDPSTRGDQRATIQNNQKDTSKNNTLKQRKALKESAKG